MDLRAPAGASVASVALEGEFRGLAGWQATLASFGGGAPGPEYINWQCPGPWCPSGIDALETYPIPNAAVVRIRVRCAAASCPNGDAYGGATLRSAAVGVNDYTPPSVRITGGTLSGGVWRAGNQNVAAEANDNTGIQALRAYVDGAVRSEQVRPGCQWGATFPCPNGGGMIGVSTSGLSDGPHPLTIQAVDPGGLAAADEQTIYIDNVPPAQPVSARVAAGDGWRAANEFPIRWTAPPQAASP